jgi:hypothetical protein
MSAVVFVHRDGRVEHRDVPPEHASLNIYRVPVRQPVRRSMSEPSVMTNKTRDYTRAACQMFDGRPIFTEPPFVAREVAVRTMVTTREDDSTIDDELRREVVRFVDNTSAIHLDALTREVDRMAAQQIKTLERREIVALPAPPED